MERGEAPTRPTGLAATGPGNLPPMRDTRRPRWLYGAGTEPDPRFSLANERTLLSWIRTSIAFAAGGGGLLIARDLIGTWSPTLATTAFALSLTIVLGAVIRWARMERALRLGGALPPPWLAVLVVGALVVGAMVGFVATVIAIR